MPSIAMQPRDLDIRTVGDMGQLPDSLPLFLWPDVPLNLDTLLIVLRFGAHDKPGAVDVLSSH
ncbi:putative sulfate permease [Pseudomonas aeruginosa]|nr:putative sulfate permease [Pseudomonas aeruginosa]